MLCPQLGGSEQEVEPGSKISKPATTGSLLTGRLHFGQVPQPSRRAQPTGNHVLTPMGPSETFHIQTMPRGNFYQGWAAPLSPRRQGVCLSHLFES